MDWGEMPDGMGRQYREMYDLCEQAAHMRADGPPSFTELMLPFNAAFVRSRARYGYEVSCQSMGYLLERLRKAIAEVEGILEVMNIAQEDALPSVEEFERGDFEIYVAHTGESSLPRYELPETPDLPYTDEEATEPTTVETETIEPVIRRQVTLHYGQTRWLGIGFSEKEQLMVLFKGEPWKK